MTPPIRRRLALPIAATATVLATLGSPARAQTPATQPAAATPATRPSAAAVEAEVAPLLKDLAGANWRARENASEALVAIGPEAAPFVREFAKTTDNAEARARAAPILARLTRDNETNASLVTLDVTDVAPVVAMDAVFEQIGQRYLAYPITIFARDRAPAAAAAAPGNAGQQGGPPVQVRIARGAAVPNVTLSVKRAPFWEVVHTLCETLNLKPLQTPHAELIAFAIARENTIHANWPKRPWAVSGPTMIVAESCERVIVPPQANNAAPVHAAVVKFGVYVEPKIKVLRAASTVKLTQVLDDQGRDLNARPTVEERLLGYDDRWWLWTIGSRIVLPHDGGGVKALNLKGEAELTVQTASQVLDVADILRVSDQSFDLAGTKVVIERCRPVNNGYELVMHVTPGGDRELTGSVVDALRRVRLVDAANRPVPCRTRPTDAVQVTHDGAGVAEHRVVLTFEPRAVADPSGMVGEPARLVWEVPTKVEKLTLPFELKNVAVP
jgi:hypothetical protein